MIAGRRFPMHAGLALVPAACAARSMLGPLVLVLLLLAGPASRSAYLKRFIEQEKVGQKGAQMDRCVQIVDKL